MFSAIPASGHDSTCLFFHHSMQQVAEEIQKLHPDTITLGGCTWNKFPDGSPNLAISSSDTAKLQRLGTQTCFLGNFSVAGDIFEQMAVIYALARGGCRGFKVIVPWFLTGTMDRVDEPGMVVTAMTLARILSATPLCATGPTQMVVYDIHALQEQFYFSDNVQVQLKTAVYLLRQQLFSLSEEQRATVSIAFPDDGACKRFRSKFSEFPLLICSKVREGEKRVVVLKEGSAEGRHCVIVDDLVQSGGTMIECAKALKRSGATRVSCFVTHGVFPNESWRKFMNNPSIDKVWMTDSVPHIAARVQDEEPFEVLSIAPLVGHLLTGQPVQN